MYEPTTEPLIDYDEVFRRGGRVFSNEEFVPFKCPFCGHVYLMDAEVDMVFLDAADLSKRKLTAVGTLDCIACGNTLPEHEPWVGESADDRYRVSPADLAGSDWAWVMKRWRGPRLPR